MLNQRFSRNFKRPIGGEPIGRLSSQLSWLAILLVVFCFPLASGFAQDYEPVSREAFDDDLLEHISLFSDVLARIQQDHLEAPESKELLYGAIRGMLRTLDPYNQFMEPETYSDFRTESRGTYGGLGMTIGIRQDRLTVVSPIKGTPADLAGMQSGDVIVEIDGESTARMTVDDAVKLLRGEPGADVTITVIREGENEPLEVTLTRDVIRFRSVEHKILNGDTGYIRINQFRDTTATDVDEAFELFNQSDIRGVILDLRSNPGGLLKSAIEVASDFLPTGDLVVYTQGRSPREDFLAESGQQQKHYPLIILVNGGSASGSEVVAGAIKDHNRGLIMGTKTFGKASVQQVFQLDGNAAVKLTVAHYFSPDGINIHKIGITPDIEAPWFSRSEHQMLTKLRNNEKIDTFIKENGDDVLAQLQTAESASSDDRDAARLLRRYQRFVDSLATEGIVFGDTGLKLAIARQTTNDLDEYEYDPQIIAAVSQLKALEIFQSLK